MGKRWRFSVKDGLGAGAATGVDTMAFNEYVGVLAAKAGVITPCSTAADTKLERTLIDWSSTDMDDLEVNVLGFLLNYTCDRRSQLHRRIVARGVPTLERTMSQDCEGRV